ncbi:MAG: glycosyltransferase family 2 protein [Acidobacteria bacterium]|nr:glycosyltransferase family 2 protein [Acidobacteriota bacterium]
MNATYDLSVVISSYNRNNTVIETVESVFRSDVEGLTGVEVIVIDDGSPNPVDSALSQIVSIPFKFDLRLLTQPNRGIGATRNRGFAEARSQIVLFLDDDIIVKRDTLKQFLEAHRRHNMPVIFGSYPFISHESESLHEFARHLYGYDSIIQNEEFEEVDAITSGLLSVNKAQLPKLEKLYQDDLAIPAAEEYEIVARFHSLGIPINRARHICVIHNHHLRLGWLAEQQFKYGLGTAEAFSKYPYIVAFERFAALKSSLDSLGAFQVRSILKMTAASRIGRNCLLKYVQISDRILKSSERNFVIGLMASAFYWAGYREGLRRFAGGKR